MNQKAIVGAVVLFALIVVGMFTFAFLKKQEIKDSVVPTDTSTEDMDIPYPSITRIDAKHFFVDGVHTLVGEVVMPTPCDLLESSATVAESMPEQVMLDFTVVNNADFCAQVLTSQRFKVSATASAAATFSARFMGRSVELNLVPAQPGETPDDFELFIKG